MPQPGMPEPGAMPKISMPTIARAHPHDSIHLQILVVDSRVVDHGLILCGVHRADSD